MAHHCWSYVITPVWSGDQTTMYALAFLGFSTAEEIQNSRSKSQQEMSLPYLFLRIRKVFWWL